MLEGELARQFWCDWLRKRMLKLNFLLVFLVSNVLSEDIVMLKQGMIKGHRLKSREGREIYAFQGIPYAKPPVGDLRFKPPQPVEEWEGVLDATAEGPECTQSGLLLTEPITGQEDCLYLNVYTPKMGSLKPLDVMFWIHGGGWQSGSGSANIYGPQYLLDKGIILVTINYRLGPFGFLSTGDSVCPGNNGLKDQTFALRWVQENIEAFGGNPNSVTIFGESAGAASVQYHMLSPLSKGLFHRGISQSGSALCTWAFSPNSTTRYQTETLAKLLNCPTESSEEIVDCLRDKDAYEIFGHIKVFMEWNIDPMIPFKPVVEIQPGEDDEPFITEEPLQTLLSNYDDLLPWMVGFLSSDGGFISAIVHGEDGLLQELDARFDELIPMAMFFRETAPKSEHKNIAQQIRQYYFGNQPIEKGNVQALTNMYTDAYFVAGIDASVKLHAKRKAPIYYFEFDYRGTNSYSNVFGGDSTTDYGVCHLDELMYLFPQNHFFPGSNMTLQDEQMIDTITTLWTNFAIYGNPTPEDSEFETWHSVTSTVSPEYAQIQYDGLKMVQDLLKDRTEFWSKLPHKARIPSAIKEEL